RNIAPAKHVGEERVVHARELASDIEAGLSPLELAQRHCDHFYFGVDVFTDVLRAMRRLELGPFEPPPGRPRRGDAKYPMMRSVPYGAISSRPIQSSAVENGDERELVLLVHPDGELRFDLPSGAARVRGKLGVKAKRFVHPPVGGVVFTIELGEHELFRVVL